MLKWLLNDASQNIHSRLPTVGEWIPPYTPHSGRGDTPIHSPQWERGYPHTLPTVGEGIPPYTPPVGEGIPPYTPHSGRGDIPIHSPNGRGNIPIHSSNTFNVCRNRLRQSPSGLCHDIITPTYGWRLASLRYVQHTTVHQSCGNVSVTHLNICIILFIFGDASGLKKICI